MLVVYKLIPQVASNGRYCTLVRLGSVPPADPGPSYMQSSSYGYIVRPVARAIKIKHAGLNLETWATSFKQQALDSRSGIV